MRQAIRRLYIPFRTFTLAGAAALIVGCTSTQSNPGDLSGGAGATKVDAVGNPADGNAGRGALIGGGVGLIGGGKAPASQADGAQRTASTASEGK